MPPILIEPRGKGANLSAIRSNEAKTTGARLRHKCSAPRHLRYSMKRLGSHRESDSARFSVA